MYACSYICTFIAFFLCTMNANTNASVDLMNNLLQRTNVGWSDLGHIEIVMVSNDGVSRRYNINDLLEFEKLGQLVTEENLADKIRISNQFLTCHFAFAFIEFVNHQIILEYLCSSLTNEDELLECNNMATLAIMDLQLIEWRMKHGLRFFTRLSSERLDFNELLSSILKHFFDNYMSPVPEEILHNLIRTKKDMDIYFSNFCWMRDFDQAIALPKLENMQPLELATLATQRIGHYTSKIYPSFGLIYDGFE